MNSQFGKSTRCVKLWNHNQNCYLEVSLRSGNQSSYKILLLSSIQLINLLYFVQLLIVLFFSINMFLILINQFALSGSSPVFILNVIGAMVAN